MRIHRFAPIDRDRYPIAVLVPRIMPEPIVDEYFKPIGMNADNCLAVQLPMREKGKTPPSKERKDFIGNYLTPELNAFGVKYLIVGNSDYFKEITGCAKSEAMLGYVAVSKYGPQKVVYVPNYTTVLYDPDTVRTKISQGINALKDHILGVYNPPGTDIIKEAHYLTNDDDIKYWLDKLVKMNVPLSIDTEAFDLKHHKAGLGSIAISWEKGKGIAFPVDFVPIEGAKTAPFGKVVRNESRRALLRDFFEAFDNTTIYHNIAFDAYLLIYQLYMDHILDTEGLLNGMDVLMKNWECTKLISYLATNTCAGNELSLKSQAQEYAGNWAVEDIKDITKIPLDQLLRYNLVDAMCNLHVLEKNHPIMVSDEQLNVYESIFKPATLDVIQMQLTGLPVHMPTVLKIEPILLKDRDVALETIHNSPEVNEVTERVRLAWIDKRNSELKTKRVGMPEAIAAGIGFNPNSDPNMQLLLFDVLGLPVLEKTASGAPSVSGDVIKALANHTTDKSVKAVLKALGDFAAVDKIITTYITALKDAAPGNDGWHYLFGNFNLGGTVSGRLSSSNPNLQNLPVKGKYGKLIKSCFIAPPGWLLTGLDFDSLEDKISAVTTRDPEKIKVYTDGFDGHCLRAYAYFNEHMPDIDPTSVESINSIKKIYGTYRDDSKAPTFALTYQGTWKTLVKNCGFPDAMAQAIEQRFKELYSVSVEWVQQKLEQATRDGYVTVAFGLRVRTPLLKQVVLNTKSTPKEAAAEGRTAGNALGQSWCLLNSRAGSEFMGKVRNSIYRYDIRPCAQIHDAQYYLVRTNLKALEYVNKHLVQAVSWQDHPDIYHDEVKLSGGYSVFYPTWNDEIHIPKGAKADEIKAVIQGSYKKAA